MDKTDQEIEEELAELGLSVDYGNLIEGWYIPDGRVRIYREDAPLHILAEGSTLQEAFEGLPSSSY